MMIWTISKYPIRMHFHRSDMPELIQVIVKLHASQSQLVLGSDGVWIAKLKSLPVDGKANQELVTLISKHWQVNKRAVKIKSGITSRRKVVEIHI